jgi:hypothetical protein
LKRTQYAKPDKLKSALVRIGVLWEKMAKNRHVYDSVFFSGKLEIDPKQIEYTVDGKIVINFLCFPSHWFREKGDYRHPRYAFEMFAFADGGFSVRNQMQAARKIADLPVEEQAKEKWKIAVRERKKETFFWKREHLHLNVPDTLPTTTCPSGKRGRNGQKTDGPTSNLGNSEAESPRSS